jgi:N-acetylglucosamine-6-sulfatase
MKILKPFSIGIFLTILSLSAYSQSSQPVFKPLEKISGAQARNIVFILSDDHRYDFMGFTGKVPWLETPNMDKMAAQGAWFNNAFVSTSLCSPSRASILTGRYSHEHTVVDNSVNAPDNLVYFSQYLQAAGYQTAFIGKWHMGGDDNPRPGFNHWESFKGQGQYFNPVLNINGEQVQYTDSVYITDLLTEHTIDWLADRDQSKPFFAYLSHKAVHGLYYPAPRHKDKYLNKHITLPPTFNQTKTGAYRDLKWPEWVAKQRVSWHGVDFMYHNSNNDLNGIVQDYCESLLGVDESIGAVLDYLDKAGLAESTLVIYMSDNGHSWGEHGLIDKRHCYEESIKIPLLVSCPELFEGGIKVNQMVQNIDIAPTCLEWAGLEKPGYMPGYSFIPLLKGEQPDWREYIFYEYFWENAYPMTPTLFAVRSDKYKYIRSYGTWDTNEFYDIENDPDEMYNLIAEPELQEEIKKYAEELYGWLENTDGMQIPLKKVIRYRGGDYKHPRQY